MRVDASLLIAGIVLRDDTRQTKNRGKMLRAAGKASVPSAELAAVLARAKEAENESAAELDAAKAEVIRQYRDSGQYRTDIVELLRPSLEQTFAQVHDYRQLIAQIVQNVNVILETTYSGDDFDTKLDSARPEIRSIYWAARLMEFKLEAALYLAYPERITDPKHKVAFRLHGAVLKYLSIYRPITDRRGLKVRVTGESYGKLMENPDAIGVIPHSFLDNAIKYAPDNAEISIHFVETDDAIKLEVTSPGPRLKRHERSRIFEFFYRGENAAQSGADGTGFGLGLAQHVADAVGADLSVQQEDRETPEGYRTTFTAVFQKPRPEDKPASIVNARERRRGGRLSF